MNNHDSPQTQQGLTSEKKPWNPPKASVVPIKLEERLMFCNFNAGSQCTYQSAN